MGREIKEFKSGERAKTNVKLQNTLTETTLPGSVSLPGYDDPVKFEGAAGAL